jgi:Na+/H+ antiporter NhaD/arsenite permease-like protein
MSLPMPSALAEAAGIDGSRLSAPWALPFAGMVLSIALLPLLAPVFWRRHFGKVAALWALALALPLAAVAGPGVALGALAHTLAAEYLPFVIVLTALFTVAGGIHIRGNLRGSPALNTGLLAAGAALANLMGTTGASMLLIRPLIRANDNRRHAAHVVVFFIFIVANAGGALTPLGDPPLFLGFLQGVDFFWALRHMAPGTLALVGALLALFYALDAWYYRRSGEIDRPDPTPDAPLAVQGKVNCALLLAVAALTLMSGMWRPGAQWSMAGMSVSLPALARDAGLIVVTLASLALTPRRVRADNQFSWAPMREVAALFAGIFVTLIPVTAMLKAGAVGPFAAALAAATRADGSLDPALYFWACGLLSSFLDNAPAYLAFFNAAGGDAATLMTTHAATLAAISAGAVFMGAMTYIGNAPNLMVKAIAEDRGVKMPGFFGYMLWSCGILLPLFAVMTFLWFR